MAVKKGLIVRFFEKYNLIRFDIFMLSGGALILRSEEILKRFEETEYLKKIV